MLAEKRRIYFFVKLYIPGMELTKNSFTSQYSF